MNIGQKLEEFRRQFEVSRKNFKAIANELKPALYQYSELEARISENNRIIDTFLTSIKNTIDYNIDKLRDFAYERSLEDFSKNFFVQCFKNENYEVYEGEDFKKIAPKPLPKTFHIKGEKIYESDESFCSENQGARSPISPSKKSTSEKKASNNFFEEINAINPFEASKPQKILSESAQCVSLCESFKNVESSNRSSKEYKAEKNYKRGPYRAYGIPLKQEAIKMMEEEGKELKEVSTILKVPIKNLKRWLKVGPLRKKGGGRKTMDPEMEALLFEWCLEEIRRNKKGISRSCIKQQAKNLSQNKSHFKASKGWLDKFMKRFNYSDRMKEILSEFKDCKKEEFVFNFSEPKSAENAHKKKIEGFLFPETIQKITKT